MEENPNFVSPEDEEDMEVDYDDDGNPIYTPKKKVTLINMIRHYQLDLSFRLSFLSLMFHQYTFTPRISDHHTSGTNRSL